MIKNGLKKKKIIFNLEDYEDEEKFKKVKFTINFKSLVKKNTHKSWHELLSSLDYSKIEDRIKDDLSKNGNIMNIFPERENIFRVFKMPLDKIKVVILGQDVYHSLDSKKEIPQAVGLAFSVPPQAVIPSSLKNIIKNLQKDPLLKFIKNKETGGDLSSWEKQGIFLLNCGLTCLEKKPGSHARLWAPLTNKIISYIAKNNKNLIFVLWGAFALDKEPLIIKESKTHQIIKSSHPSGLSCNKPLKSYPAFMQCHFASLVNKLLKDKNIKEINWNF